jgi:pimeloyl-ACP methyl ester carboxylesterase
MSRDDVSVVLVHGAWADGSSWAKVIGPLAAEGVRVLAAPLPLTSFADDTAALERALERVSGPVVVAAHAYAGAVIAATRNEKVKTLVYVAALAPEEGETVADVFYRTEPDPLAPKLAPDNHGLIYLPEEAFAAAFAQNAAGRRIGPTLRGSAADFALVQHATYEPSTLERPPQLVSHGGTRPHDRPRDAALYGGADARSGAVAFCRPRTHRYCASPGRRHHKRCNQGSAQQLIDPIHDRLHVIRDKRKPQW